MSDHDDEKLECMFSNSKAAAFCLFFQSLGLRSTQLAEFPRDAILGIADMEEHAYRSIMKDAYYPDKEEDEPERKVVELVKKEKEKLEKV